MVNVIVELWGPMNREGGYSWVPVGQIQADSLDIDYMKKETIKIIENIEWKSTANMARLRVLKNNKEGTDAEGRPITVMKITLEDLW